MNNNLSKRPKILIAGPNPSWQKTMIFEHFAAGRVNRAESMHIFASGKGVNAARAVSTWNQAEARVLQFAGGANGRDLTARLQADNIAHVTVRTAGETRSCTTCLDRNGAMTELIEPSVPVSADELAQYMAFFREFAPKFDGVIACGTAPGGANLEYCRALSHEIVCGPEMPLLLDACKDISPLLESGRVTCLKLNAEELSELAGPSPIPEALTAAREKYGLPMAAVTDGAEPAYFSTCDGLWRYTLPALPRVVNPLGSGDSCNGILWSEILRGTAPELAFRFALAAASANCLSLFCGHFPVADAANIFARIEVEKLQ